MLIDNKTKENIVRIIIATAIGLISAIIMLIMVTILISSEILDYKSVGEIFSGINFASASISGMIGTKKKTRMLLTGAVIGIIYLSIMLLIGIYLNKGWINLQDLLRIIISSLFGAMFGSTLRIGKCNKKFHKSHRTRRLDNK